MPLGSWNVSAINHAIGIRPTRLIATADKSCDQIVLIGSPVRALTAARARDQLTVKKTSPAKTAAMNDWTLKKEKPGPASKSAAAANATPARVPEIASSAWLNTVPYHGMRPRTSRLSIVPITPTAAPASGPPRIAAPKIGAAATETTVPRGSCTGRALAAKARAIQYITPARPLISGRSGNSAIAAAITRTAAATVARMRR